MAVPGVSWSWRVQTPGCVIRFSCAICVREVGGHLKVVQLIDLGPLVLELWRTIFVVHAAMESPGLPLGKIHSLRIVPCHTVGLIPEQPPVLWLQEAGVAEVQWVLTLGCGEVIVAEVPDGIRSAVLLHDGGPGLGRVETRAILYVVGVPPHTSVRHCKSLYLWLDPWLFASNSTSGGLHKSGTNVYVPLEIDIDSLEV